MFNLLTPNDHYSGRTAPLTSKRYILYIYSTNIGTEYFKHGVYSPFFPLQNAVCFIILTYLVPILLTFYIQDVLKLKKNSGAKRLDSIQAPPKQTRNKSIMFLASPVLSPGDEAWTIRKQQESRLTTGVKNFFRVKLPAVVFWTTKVTNYL